MLPSSTELADTRTSLGESGSTRTIHKTHSSLDLGLKFWHHVLNMHADATYTTPPPVLKHIQSGAVRQKKNNENLNTKMLIFGKIRPHLN